MRDGLANLEGVGRSRCFDNGSRPAASWDAGVLGLLILGCSGTIPAVAHHERGLYETLITEALEEQLGALGDRLEARRSELHEAEAADRLALHLSRVVERAIASLDKSERVAQGTALARQLVNVIVEATQANELGFERPVSPADVLRSGA